jgi:hypothetical protein
LKLFLSWSGEQSKVVATALHGWLRMVIQRIEPFLSSHDIAIGSSGVERISDELELADAGIFCLNKENFTAPWINFEAGAVSKHRGNSRVCTYLVDIEPIEVTGPLSKFQHARANKDETLKMLRDICQQPDPPLLPSDVLGRVFEKQWPDLEAELNHARQVPLCAPKDDRDEVDMLQEALGLIRDLAKRGDTPQHVDLKQFENLALREKEIHAQLRRISNADARLQDWENRLRDQEEELKRRESLFYKLESTLPPGDYIR